MSQDMASSLSATTAQLQCDQFTILTPTLPRSPPPPPVPSSDPRLAIASTVADGNTTKRSSQDDKPDLFKLKPLEALQLLSASVELLVRITGDIPPTPPPTTPTNPQMSNMQVEKEKIARSHSEKNLARLRAQVKEEPTENGPSAQAMKEEPSEDGPSALRRGNELLEASLAASVTSSTFASTSIDGVRLKHEQHTPEPYVIVGEDSKPINLQHGAITRKFYSKNEPPISVNQYLLRLHQFCPMSTAVYLATSLYIHRLAVEERTIPVTRRNAHRLVLAGLRVAMKALEDLSYPHTKVAKVGGVSEVELARLEISFCFLAGFELVVGEEGLRRHWEALRDGGVERIMDGLDGMKKQ